MSAYKRKIKRNCHQLRFMLDYNIKRRAELTEKHAPVWMLNRYSEEIESLRNQVALLESEIEYMDAQRRARKADRT